MWIIKRTDQGGGYLTPSGSNHSFTHKLEEARTFPSKEAADAECCKGNEVAIPLSSVLKMPN